MHARAKPWCEIHQCARHRATGKTFFMCRLCENDRHRRRYHERRYGGNDGPGNDPEPRDEAVLAADADDLDRAIGYEPDIPTPEPTEALVVALWYLRARALRKAREGALT